MVTIFLRNWDPKLKPKHKRNARDKTFPKNVKGSFIRELEEQNGTFTGVDVKF